MHFIFIYLFLFDLFFFWSFVFTCFDVKKTPTENLHAQSTKKERKKIVLLLLIRKHNSKLYQFWFELFALTKERMENEQTKMTMLKLYSWLMLEKDWDDDIAKEQRKNNVLRQIKICFIFRSIRVMPCYCCRRCRKKNLRKNSIFICCMHF